MQEEPDEYIGTERSQHLRDQLELVVMDPDRAAGGDILRDRHREAHIHFAIRVPPGAVIRRGANGVVVQRPNRGVGEAEVELLVLLRTQGDRLQANPLVGGGWLLMLGGSGPANPEPLSIDEY